MHLIYQPFKTAHGVGFAWDDFFAADPRGLVPPIAAPVLSYANHSGRIGLQVNGRSVRLQQLLQNAGPQQITKALSVRTAHSEHEVAGERPIVRIGGRNYRNPEVKGELLLCNHRDESIKVVVRRRFSGELIEADGSPENVIREDGVYSVNPRHELTWTVELEPGEERTIEYRYSVLVYH